MHSLSSILLLFTSSMPHALSLYRRSPARFAVTNNIVQLKTAPLSPHLIPPSSKHLVKRRNALNARSASTKRQDVPIADIQEDLITLGGRVYMADITLTNQPFTLVLDTGSSDTWVASSSFRCVAPHTQTRVRAPRSCAFSTYYDPSNSSTWSPISSHVFAVDYAGGEFLRGELGTEMLGIGGVWEGDGPRETVRQTIGVVDRGFWLGDGVSAGLMGLAFPAMVSGAGRLKYNSVMFTLTSSSPTPLFSLALSRPNATHPRAGGILAIGGIPDIPYDGPFVTVPMQPVYEDIYAYYAINVDGFDITPPPPPASPPSPPLSSKNRNRNKQSSSSPTNSNLRRQLIPPSPNLTASCPTTLTLDSGTSLLQLPDSIAVYIASLFLPPAIYNPSSGLYIVSCNAAAPRVGIIIGGKSFFIHEDDLMNRREGAVGGPRIAGKGGCVVAVQGSGRGRGVLGDAWLKGVLVVFDLERREVSVAAREDY